jgi:hypothetical protein
MQLLLAPNDRILATGTESGYVSLFDVSDMQTDNVKRITPLIKRWFSRNLVLYSRNNLVILNNGF